MEKKWENFFNQQKERLEKVEKEVKEIKVVDFINSNKEEFIHQFLKASMLEIEVENFCKSFNLINKASDKIKNKESLNLLPPSDLLMDVNNQLLKTIVEYQQNFEKNKDIIVFSNKTKNFAYYFEKESNLFSFFQKTRIINDDESKRVFSEFLYLYNTPHIMDNFDDELFCYMAIIYLLNETMGRISDILPNYVLLL